MVTVVHTLAPSTAELLKKVYPTGLVGSFTVLWTARSPGWMTVLVTVAFRPLGTLQILNVSHRLLLLPVMVREIRIGYFVSFLKLMVCLVLPTIQTVASRPGGYRLMNSLWFCRESGIMPARKAALNSVVDVVQMPPPNAPVTVIFPPSIALPGPVPGSLRRAPTTFQKSKIPPGGTSVAVS